ncbi:4846_t:CDS:2, partial [Funneliformis geosporum]
IYANTEDFLMVSTLTNGKSLEDSMESTTPVSTTTVQQSNTEDILTKTTYVVTEIETV